MHRTYVNESTRARSSRPTLVLAAVLAALSSCTPKGGGEPAGASSGSSPASAIEVRSPAFAAGSEIPRKHTCEGEDLAPPLSWSGLPAATRSVALVVDDPDAPDPKAPKTTWVHWVLYNLPPDAVALPEGGKPLPPGALEGHNDWKRAGYGGPCPPIGRHRYFHKIYALDLVLPDLGQPTKADLEKAMAGHIIARGELVGTYQKSAATP